MGVAGGGAGRVRVSSDGVQGASAGERGCRTRWKVDSLLPHFSLRLISVILTLSHSFNLYKRWDTPLVCTAPLNEAAPPPPSTPTPPLPTPSPSSTPSRSSGLPTAPPSTARSTSTSPSCKTRATSLFESGQGRLTAVGNSRRNFNRGGGTLRREQGASQLRCAILPTLPTLLPLLQPPPSQPLDLLPLSMELTMGSCTLLFSPAFS